DLVPPAGDRAAELADLRWTRVVLEVRAEAGDELEADVGIGVVVDLADDLLGVPRHAHLALGVARLEQPHELLPTAIVEAFVSSGEEPAGPVERVVLAAPMTEGLVLDPSTDLVETLVRELAHMERIRDLGGVGEHRVERQTPRARQGQHGEAD